MKKRYHILSVLLTTSLLLTSCGSTASTAAISEDAATGTQTTAADETTEKTEEASEVSAVSDNTVVWPDPAIEGNLLDSPTVGDDFLQYTCHDWYANTKIPDGYTRWTNFNTLTQNITTQLTDTLQNPDDSHDQQNAAAFYHAAMDMSTRDQAGYGSLMDTFQAVQQIQTLEELTKLLKTDLNLYYFCPLVSTDVSADLKNSTVNVAGINSPYLSLNDSAEYENMTDQGKRFKTANDKYFKALLTHCGTEEKEAEQMIADSFEWEGKLASKIYPVSTQYRSDYYNLIYNEMTPDELAALSPDFPLMDVLNQVGFQKASRFIVSEPDSIKQLNALYTEENLAGIKSYIQINLLSMAAPYTDSYSADATIEWNNEKLGSSGRKTQELYAYDICNKYIGELLGKIYTDKYFDENSKADATEMITAVSNAFRKRLTDADWLSEATRSTALEKLDTMTVNVGYPTKYMFDWENTNISADSSLLDLVKERTYVMGKYKSDLIDTPVDRGCWTMSAHTVNAFYDPTTNSINFPAAILHAPFYDVDASRSANLGGIGTVIGHELTHAFDTMGSQFDKDGNMKNWWTDEDLAAFKERTDKVAARYSSIDVTNGEHVQGDLTIGETVADLGGVASTLDIMHSLDNPDYEEYFTSFATLWEERISPEQRSSLLKADAHAPAYLRANITSQQFQEFYDTFDVKEGDFMYVAPEERLKVW